MVGQFDKMGLGPNQVITPPLQFERYDKETNEIVCRFLSHSDFVKYHSNIAKQFMGSGHPLLAYASLSKIPDSKEKHIVLSEIFEKAAEVKKSQEPNDYKIPLLRDKSDKHIAAKEKIENDFDACIHQMQKLFTMQCDLDHFFENFKKANTLSPNSFKPLRLLLIIATLPKLMPKLPIRDIFEEAYQCSEMNTYLTLMMLLQYQVNHDVQSKKHSISTILDFLIEKNPNDFVLLEYVKMIKEHIPDLRIQKQSLEKLDEVILEKKNEYHNHFTQGLKHWLNGEIDHAKKAWLQAKKYFYADCETYTFMAIYHSHTHHLQEAIQCMIRALEVRVITDKESHSVFLKKLTHDMGQSKKAPIPSSTLAIDILKSYVSFQRTLLAGGDPLLALNQTTQKIEKILTENAFEINCDNLLATYYVIISLMNTRSLFTRADDDKSTLLQTFMLILYEILSPNHLPEEMKNAVQKVGEGKYQIEYMYFDDIPEEQTPLDDTHHLSRRLFRETYNQFVLFKSDDAIPYCNNEKLLLSCLKKDARAKSWASFFKNIALQKEAHKEIIPLILEWVIDQLTATSSGFNELEVARHYLRNTESDLLIFLNVVDSIINNKPLHNIELYKRSSLLIQLSKKLANPAHPLDLEKTWKEERNLYPNLPLYTVLVSTQQPLATLVGTTLEEHKTMLTKNLHRPSMELTATLAKYERDLIAFTAFPRIYHAPSTKNTYQEVFAASDLIFGLNYLETARQHYERIHSLTLPSVFNPNLVKDIELGPVKINHGAWSLSIDTPVESSYGILSILKHKEIQISEIRLNKQEAIEDDTPQYQVPDGFVDWVKAPNSPIIEMIRNGKETLPKTFEGKVPITFFEQLKSKIKHHKTIMATKEKCKNGNIHYLTASLISEATECKHGGEGFYLWVEDERSARLVMQLIYCYSRDKLRKAELAKRLRDLNNQIDLPTLEEIQKIETEKLSEAFHGPETHIFGHGPRYQHYNAGVYKNGELVNTHICFG